MPRMVTFKTHTRGDALLKPGDEFDATDAEMHAYAARTNPLAGPLEDDAPPAPKKVAKAAKKAAPMPAAPMSRKRGGKK